MKYKAVLFDLDGTLLNTLDDLADSMNDVLRHFGFPAHPVPAYKYFVGDGLEKLVYRAVPEDRRDEATLAACLAAMRQDYDRRWADKTAPYDGIPELLDGLAALGLPMTVFSNKPDEFTRVMVARLLPRWRFEAVFGARPGVPKKPDPAVPLEMAQRLQVPPAEWLYLGDTNTDMRTARAAGMYPAGVLWGFRPAEELLESGAQVLVEKPGDVLKLL